MQTDRSESGAGTNRRQFMSAAGAMAAGITLEAVTLAAGPVETGPAAAGPAATGPVAAEVRLPVMTSAVKAVAFDAFAVFDAGPVARLAEQLFPGRGMELSSQWRARQFEYTWLRNSMRRYADFWQVTEEALTYAAKQSKLQLKPGQSEQLMSAYLQLKPWPDVAAVMEVLSKGGLRLALLSNMTSGMMQSCVQGSGLDGLFEFQLSTDRVQVFKPDAAAYGMALEAFQLKRHEIAFVAFGGWDAAGAKAFGYATYWANRLGVPREELGVYADATYGDLRSLAEFIDSLGGASQKESSQ